MAQATPNSEWISVKEMQHLLSIGKSKAYSILQEVEEIEIVQLNTAIRVNRASLERWLRKQRYPRWRED